MSRSRHRLRCTEWWGDWALMFHRDNRELRQRGREQRDKDRVRVDARQDIAEQHAIERAHALCLAGTELCDECAALEREARGDYLASIEPEPYDDGLDEYDDCEVFA